MSQIVSGQIRVPNPGPLVFGTDGSVSMKRTNSGGYMTGWGYLSSHGHWAAAHTPQPKDIAGRDRATVAELRAVWHAIGGLLASTPVTVVTDSANACRFVEAWKTSNLVMPLGYTGSRRHKPRMLALAEAVARHPENLTVLWVKGHTGHLLNEAADCLARLGCRWLVQNMPREAVERRAQFVAEGFLADPRIREAVAA